MLPLDVAFGCWLWLLLLVDQVIAVLIGCVALWLGVGLAGAILLTEMLMLYFPMHLQVTAPIQQQLLMLQINNITMQ